MCEVGFRLVRIRSAAPTGRSGKASAAGNIIPVRRKDAAEYTESKRSNLFCEAGLLNLSRAMIGLSTRTNSVTAV
jgi:hypothetical protein